MTEVQAELICTLTDSQATLDAIDVIMRDLTETEVARMRSAVASADWHEATLCEGRMQAISDFVRDLQTVSAKLRKKQKGPLRDSL